MPNKHTFNRYELAEFLNYVSKEWLELHSTVEFDQFTRTMKLTIDDINEEDFKNIMDTD